MLLSDLFSVWKQGKAVANPVAWKNVAATTAALAGIITGGLGLAKFFGYNVEIDNATIQGLAEGIASLLFLFVGGVHITSSDKVGLPAESEPTGGGTVSSNSVGADPEAVRKFLNGG